MANYPYNNPYQAGQFSQAGGYNPSAFGNSGYNPYAAINSQNMSAYNQPQQYQPTVQLQNATAGNPSLLGRTVGNSNEISASEVPMDGLGYFPISDGSAIFVKTWLGDGSIRTIEYVPKEPLEAVSEPTNGNYDAIMERFDKVEDAIQSMERAIADVAALQKPRTTRSAKKVEDE